jgi:type II secretory pathway pseudopilin PulG
VIRKRDQRGFTIIDALITLCLIGILIGVVIPKYQRMAREAQAVAVKAELTSIRTSISLFRMLNNRNPESLRELIEKKVMLPARTGTDRYSGSVFDRNYLMSQAVDSKGNIVDAFANPFAYDPARGEVKATTKGCEGW